MLFLSLWFAVFFHNFETIFDIFLIFSCRLETEIMILNTFRTMIEFLTTCISDNFLFSNSMTWTLTFPLCGNETSMFFWFYFTTFWFLLHSMHLSFEVKKCMSKEEANVRILISCFQCPYPFWLLLTLCLSPILSILCSFSFHLSSTLHIAALYIAIEWSIYITLAMEINKNYGNKQQWMNVYLMWACKCSNAFERLWQLEDKGEVKGSKLNLVLIQGKW